jgi:TrmH family RNA methyltransferase
LIFSNELIRTEGARKILDFSQENGVETLEVSASVFNAISVKENPQGIAAVFSQTWRSVDDVFGDISGLWLALYEVADPGNLGTIIRTMDAVGGKGILLVGNCTDPYDPGAIRASMGAIFSLDLCKIERSKLIDLIHQRKILAIGTSDKARTEFHQQEYQKNMILLMGSEREGLSQDLQAVCTGMVSIPMMGIGDSLNLAVATGVVLYEILNQVRTDIVRKK